MLEVGRIAVRIPQRRWVIVMKRPVDSKLRHTAFTRACVDIGAGRNRLQFGFQARPLTSMTGAETWPVAGEGAENRRRAETPWAVLAQW